MGLTVSRTAALASPVPGVGSQSPVPGAGRGRQQRDMRGDHRCGSVSFQPVQKTGPCRQGWHNAMFLKISFCLLGGIVLLFVGTLLIGGLPSLLFDARFLPSQDWVARSSGAANLAGLFLGAYAFLVMLACPLKDPSVLEQVPFKKRPWLKLMLVSFFAGGLLWGSSYMIVVQGVPMVQAAVAGTEVRLAYTVEWPRHSRGGSAPGRSSSHICLHR